MTTAQKLREEGIEQGIEQGIERGIEQGLLLGEQELLCKQLEWRFGKILSSEKEMIQSCQSRDQLDQASKALIQEKTKQEILACLDERSS